MPSLADAFDVAADSDGDEAEWDTNLDDSDALYDDYYENVVARVRANAVETVHLNGCGLVDISALAAALAANTTATIVRLDGNRIADVAPLAAMLAANTTITALHLGRNRIVDAAPLLAAVARHPSLAVLSLYGNDVEPECVAALAQNKTLRTLTLPYGLHNYTALAAALRGNTALRTLRFVEPCGTPIKIFKRRQPAEPEQLAPQGA